MSVTAAGVGIDPGMVKDLERGMSGYAKTDDIIAFGMTQGGRQNFTTPMALGLIPDQLPIPDPEEVSDENRELRVPHAKAFGQYVLDNPTWTSPPLMVRVPREAIDWKKSEVIIDLGPTKVWRLALKRAYRHLKKILDGQHRIYGIADAREELDEALQKAINHRAGAKRDGDRDAVAHWDRQVTELEDKRTWFDSESIMVQLVIEDDADASRQIFVDIADNALGINKSVRVGFDQRDPVNRATRLLVDSEPHPLLDGRVNDQKSRVSGKSSDLLARAHVADLVKIVELGIGGRMTRGRQSTLSEQVLADNAAEFLDLLTSSFDDLSDVATRRLSPADLRDRSLLGSVTMLRVLAGAYHELMSAGRDEGDVEKLFRSMNPHMAVPIDAATASGRLWLAAGRPTEAFVEGGTAPGARSQQVSQLVDTIAGWIDNPPSDLG